MKAGLCVAVLLLIGASTVLLWHGAREKQTSRQQSALAELRVQEAQAELEQARAREKQLESAPPKVVVVTNHVRAAESQQAGAESKLAARSAMLKDPETRALMRKQQEQGLAKFADKMVSPEFVKQWKLSPEESAKTKGLFAERGGAGKDMLNAMMFDGLDDDALAQRGRETKQRIEAAEAGLREILGVDGFNALVEREHTHQDRDQIKRMREDIGAGGEPLTNEQQEALVSAFIAERQGFNFRVDLSDPSKVDFEHIRDFFSAANLDKYFEDMQQLNARVAERAASVLSPTQLEQLKTAQNNRLDQARLTVKMTTELFNKRRGN